MITLVQGLADLSKELGESTTNTSTRRIAHYCDAIQEFANEKKWPFLVKLNNDLVTAASNGAVDITSVTDIRMPGGIQEITVDGEDNPFLPIDYKNRMYPPNDNRFYITPDEQSIKFTKELAAGLTISMWHWYVPERIEDLNSLESFPIPARYRKALGTLAGAFVQYSRYLDAQGGRMINIYNRLLAKIEGNQSERNSGTPATMPNPMSFHGPMRRYPPYGRRAR